MIKNDEFLFYDKVFDSKQWYLVNYRKSWVRVYKLKDLLQNKNGMFFIICYSIRTEFITEAATKISSSK